MNFSVHINQCYYQHQIIHFINLQIVIIQIKMTEESAEYACGQILFNLKSSNLHYLVKETHLSAYITIRKKFIKPQTVNIRNDKIEVIKDVNSFDDRIRLENGLLKQEINELKTKCANWEVEYEEMEIRINTFQDTTSVKSIFPMFS